MTQVICKKGRFGAWRLEQVGPEQRPEQSPSASQSVDDPMRSGDDMTWGGALSSSALSKYAKSQRKVARRRAPVEQDRADMYLNQRESLLFSGAASCKLTGLPGAGGSWNQEVGLGWCGLGRGLARGVIGWTCWGLCGAYLCWGWRQTCTDGAVGGSLSPSVLRLHVLVGRKLAHMRCL